jgi:5-hydroxyisourate hydrolase-like protein (transthyretin family)
MARRALAALVGCVALFALAPSALASTGTGRISGTVEAGGKPAESVSVEVFTAGRELVGSATTNASGTYEVASLAAGSYKVEFIPGHGSMDAPQFYSGKPSFAEATEVLVEEEKTHSGIDAELHEGGSITGTVTGAGTGGLEHVDVFVSIAGEELIGGGFAVTGAAGKYEIKGLPTGSYTVEFYPEYGYGLNFVPQYYENADLLGDAKKVSVTEGTNTPGINAELKEGGKISGTVTDASTHKPVANVYVSAYKTSGGGEEGFEENYAKTNASGEYTIIGLVSGTYKVEFEAEPGTGTEYIKQYYNDEPAFASANPVTANQGSTTPGINAALVRKAPVNTAGPVASGVPVAGHALSCSTGSWTGEPTLTYTYAWLRNGVAIAGADGSLYGVQTADQGKGLACRVTATNKHGSASAVSNTLTVQVPKPPPPPPSPKPQVKLLNPYIVASGRSARVPIACARVTCTGTIELIERIVVRHRHHGRTRTRRETIVLASGSYALGAGQSATVFVHLTHAGRKALARARHHRLLIRVIASVAGGATARESALLSEVFRHRHRHR